MWSRVNETACVPEGKKVSPYTFNDPWTLGTVDSPSSPFPVAPWRLLCRNKPEMRNFWFRAGILRCPHSQILCPHTRHSQPIFVLLSLQFAPHKTYLQAENWTSVQTLCVPSGRTNLLDGYPVYIGRPVYTIFFFIFQYWVLILTQPHYRGRYREYPFITVSDTGF